MIDDDDGGAGSEPMPDNDMPDNDMPDNDMPADDRPVSDMPESTMHGQGGRCGFIALVGAPNAGKSTLLNALTGAKVSIVSPKAQTTRMRVLGITIEGDSQLIFVDTPGIFSPRRRLDRAMVAAAWQGADDADMVGVLVDCAHRGIGEDTQAIIQRLKASGRTAILIVNKIDLVRRDTLLGLVDTLNRDGTFTETFMVSATTGDGVADLRRHFAAAVSEGPWLYPEDQISDMPMRLLAAELTREKLYLQLHQELPYSAAVETESWEEFDDGSVKISQVVYIQRDGQKAIVLGKGGQRIKQIGQAARSELETLLERRVHLMLFVKVRENWVDDPERYRDLGLDFGSR
jgi:GTP-binding protein Era